MPNHYNHCPGQFPRYPGNGDGISAIYPSFTSSSDVGKWTDTKSVRFVIQVQMKLVDPSVFRSVLPATLFSNRAQCHLNLGDYENAVEDCDEAIARCLGGKQNEAYCQVKLELRASSVEMSNFTYC